MSWTDQIPVMEQNEIEKLRGVVEKQAAHISQLHATIAHQSSRINTLLDTMNRMMEKKDAA